MQFIELFLLFASLLSFAFGAPISRHQESKLPDTNAQLHDSYRHPAMYLALDTPGILVHGEPEQEHEIQDFRLDIPFGKQSGRHRPQSKAHTLIARSKIGNKIKNFFKGAVKKVASVAKKLISHGVERLSNPLAMSGPGDAILRANRVLNKKP